MAKDPAFLFYSKDWLEGTAEMTPEEKGVYIDLLCHQHQKGSIPADLKRLSRMVGLSEDDFSRIWHALQEKFVNHSVDRLVNRRLTEVTTERSTKSHTNGITGRFAVLIRSCEPKVREKLKAEFRVADYLPFSTEMATERLTEWFYKRLPILANAIANEDGNVNESKGGLGENGSIPAFHSKTLTGQMIEVWVQTFPGYTKDPERDLPALKCIADFIFKQGGISDGFVNSESQIKCLNTFQLIADQVNREEFWVNKSLKSISSHIQEFYNKIKNTTANGSSKSKQGNGKLNVNKLKEEHAKQLRSRYGGGG